MSTVRTLKTLVPHASHYVRLRRCMLDGNGGLRLPVIAVEKTPLTAASLVCVGVLRTDDVASLPPDTPFHAICLLTNLHAQPTPDTEYLLDPGTFDYYHEKKAATDDDDDTAAMSPDDRPPTQDWYVDKARLAAMPPISMARDQLAECLLEYQVRLYDLHAMVSADPAHVMGMPSAACLDYARTHRWAVGRTALDHDADLRRQVMGYVFATMVMHMPRTRDRLRWAHLDAVLARIMSDPGLRPSTLPSRHADRAVADASWLSAHGHRATLTEALIKFTGRPPPVGHGFEDNRVRQHLRKLVAKGFDTRTVEDAYALSTWVRPETTDTEHRPWHAVLVGHAKAVKATARPERSYRPAPMLLGETDLEDLDKHLPPCFHAVVTRGRANGHLQNTDRFTVSAFFARLGLRNVEETATFVLGPGYNMHDDLIGQMRSDMHAHARPEDARCQSCATIRTKIGPAPTEDHALHCPFEEPNACLRAAGLQGTLHRPSDFVTLSRARLMI